MEFMSPKGHARFVDELEQVADTLILAGDITTLHFLDQMRDAFRPFCELWREVIYVPGNHEYYGESPSHCENLLKTLLNEYSNLYWLRPNQPPLDIRGTTFWGGTMWFPDGPNNGVLAHNLNDFEMIKKFVPWVYQENTFFRECYGQHRADVVVTHHLPSQKSVAERFKNDALNIFFVSDMEKKMNIWQPKLWVHGHIHSPADYKLGDMRVVCNPRGYPLEGRCDFNDRFVVEI
jgi:UDP-2,3-diacylglucosamine pyrophosphatase LpxH